MDKCKLFGHKWIPLYIGNPKYKFIATYCDRCGKGKKELLDAIQYIPHNYNTYNEDYFEEKQLNTK